jgi:DNA-binding NarL/FixJ family response regulator
MLSLTSVQDAAESIKPTQTQRDLKRCEMNLSTSTESDLPRVVLVDDHPAVLRQTLQLISARFKIIAALSDGSELISIARKKEIDLIVLDITLPGPSGIALAERLKEAGYPGKIVFLTVHADPDYVRQAFEVGATGYVVKPRLASDLIPALDAALAGKTFISPCPELKEVV